MRNLVLLFLLTTAACATSQTTGAGGKANVLYVKKDIAAAIDASPGEAGPRSIVSMGATTTDKAVVYTDAADGRREETWVRGPSGWTMTEGKVVSAAK
jgi:hypothetical protein